MWGGSQQWELLPLPALYRTSFAAHRLLACWPPLPVVGLLASPASSHVSAPPAALA